MQNATDGQDTERSSAITTGTGADHELPLKVSAEKWTSTAAQNDADGHDTELSEYDRRCSPARPTSCR